MSSREPGETWRGEKSCREALLLLRGISTGSLCPFPVLKTCCTALQNSWASSHFVVELNSIVRFILSPCISVWVVPQGLQLYTFKSLHGDTALMLFFSVFKRNVQKLSWNSHGYHFSFTSILWKHVACRSNLVNLCHVGWRGLHREPSVVSRKWHVAWH